MIKSVYFIVLSAMCILVLGGCVKKEDTLAKIEVRNENNEWYFNV
jgi:hypothetical protein